MAERRLELRYQSQVDQKAMKIIDQDILQAFEDFREFIEQIEQSFEEIYYEYQCRFSRD